MTEQERYKKIAELCTALAESKTLQRRPTNVKGDWENYNCVNLDLAYTTGNYEYRVAPPEPSVVWRYDYQYEIKGHVSHSWYTDEQLTHILAGKNQYDKISYNPGTGPYFIGRVKYVQEKA